MRHETLRLWRPCGRAIGLAAISTCLTVSRHPRQVSGLMSHVSAPVPASPVAGPSSGGKGVAPASGLNVLMSHVSSASLGSHVSCQRASFHIASGGPIARRENGRFLTNDTRHSTGTAATRHATGASRKVVMSPRASPIACRASPTKNFFQLFSPAPLRVPLAFATLATVSDGPGLPKGRG